MSELIETPGLKEFFSDPDIQYALTMGNIQECYDELNIRRKNRFDPMVPAFTKVLLSAGINPLEYQTRIINCQFDGIQELKGLLVIPSNIKTIEPTAFSYCRGLTNLKIEDGCETIGGQAFLYCENLRTIEIPKSVTTIGTGCFSCCGKISKVVMPAKYSSRGKPGEPLSKLGTKIENIFGPGFFERHQNETCEFKFIR